jgi:membrane-associated phospholipid phosphatase
MDRSISNFFVDNRPEWLGHLAKFVSYLGQFPIHIVILIGLGVILKKRSDLILKRLFDRARPPKSDWFEGYHAHGFSLPSGHAVNAAVLGVFIYLWLPARWRWVGPVVAVAVMWSRVQLGVHWPSDVIFGAAIGGAIAFGGTRILDKRTAETI